MSTNPSSSDTEGDQKPTAEAGTDRSKGSFRDEYPRRTSHSDTGDRSQRVVPLEVQLRKFHRDTQQNGILSEIKRRRFSEKPVSRLKKRESAIRKAARRRIRYGY